MRQLLAFAFVSVFTLSVAAQPPATPPAPPTPPGTAANASPVKKDDKPKPIKDVLPDAKKISGLLNFYQKKDKTLYAEVKSSNLNTDYLISTAIAQGSGTFAIGGYTLDDTYWQFRKSNDRIQVVKRNIRYKADPGTPEAQAVQVAYSDSVLYSLPILATGEDGGDVIDLAPIFMSGVESVRFDSSRSSWGEVKGFPNNMEFRVKATMSGGIYSDIYSNNSPDPRAIGVTIHYSISKLPSGGYSPRQADNRIGYFLTDHVNYSKKTDDDHTIRYINRWNLQKADPSATLSPPKKPIVFWIEKTVPFKYRDAIRQGVLEWNKAFEKIGFVNAIEVRQQSESDTWDSEDINYATIRWITSSAGFAMGPSRVNPLTGEIVDADIIIDADWVDYTQRRFDWQVGEVIPSGTNGSANSKQPFAWCKQQLEAKEESQKHQHGKMSDCVCEYGKEKASQLALLNLALLADENNNQCGDEEGKKEDKKEDEKTEENKNGLTPKATAKQDNSADEKKDEPKKEDDKEAERDDAKKDKKTPGEKKDDAKLAEKKKQREEKMYQFVCQCIKDVTMHEVGHTLGLRHNFQASSWLTLAEINDPNRSKEFCFVGSVMDYSAINLAAKGQPQGDYFPATLGPYDYLAIEYGYKVIAGDESKELAKIAAHQSEPGKNFATDENLWLGNADDPRVQLRDLGSNPIDFAKVNEERYNQFLPEILERAMTENGSYRDIGAYYLMLVRNRVVANNALAANIGGLYQNRDRKGDPGNRSPMQVVDAKRQREAVKYLCDTVLKADAFTVAPELYNKFGAEFWLTGDYRMTMSGGVPVGTVQKAIQIYTLEKMIHPGVLEGLEDTALRVGAKDDLFTADELFNTLTTSVFSELDKLEGEFTARKPAIPLPRRVLQEYYFQILTFYAWTTSTANSANSLSVEQLKTIQGKIQRVDKSRLDSGSQAYLSNLHERIKKVLEASLQKDTP
ncbi:hypothetical protein FACS189454_01610 [Planctomycetales bacterium]|nr:hypothetical protein FACS189454_01610 [Planctomycetales bacterium]